MLSTWNIFEFDVHKNTKKWCIKAVREAQNNHRTKTVVTKLIIAFLIEFNANPEYACL